MSLLVSFQRESRESASSTLRHPEETGSKTAMLTDEGEEGGPRHLQILEEAARAATIDGGSSSVEARLLRAPFENPTWFREPRPAGSRNERECSWETREGRSHTRGNG